MHPLILISSDFHKRGDVTFHRIYDQYLYSINYIQKATPVFMPAFEIDFDFTPLLEKIDGILLTGARSNIEPKHYHKNQDNLNNKRFLDQRRDYTNLKMIDLALKYKIPILGICRGLQEINVALGGTLKDNIQDDPDHFDHRAPLGLPRDQTYAPRHEVHLKHDGFLAKLLQKNSLKVNSLHRQAINNLGRDLIIEAKAEDGIIEAIKLDRNDHFCLGLQWHPEYFIDQDRDAQKIFESFGQNIHHYAKKRLK